jgi:hypothetical protein
MVFEGLRNLGRRSFGDGQQGAVLGFLRPIATERIAEKLQLDFTAPRRDADDFGHGPLGEPDDHPQI